MTTNAIDIYDERQGELIPYAESDEWRRAYAVWLAGKRQHTRRAYAVSYTHLDVYKRQVLPHCYFPRASASPSCVEIRGLF